MRKDYLKSSIIGLITLLLFLSIYTYHPYDPGIGITGSDEIKNKAGFIGAYLSSFLYFLFGIVSLSIPVLLTFGLIFFLLGFPLRQIFLSLILMICTWCVLLGHVLDQTGFKNYLLFNRYPLNGGFVGELHIILRTFLGETLFLTITLLLLLFSFFIGVGINKPLKGLLTRFKLLSRTSKIKEEKKHKDEEIDLRAKDIVKSEEGFFIINEGKSMDTKVSSLEFKNITQKTSQPEGFKEKILPPPIDLLKNPPTSAYKLRPEELKERALLLVSKLREFGIEGEVVGISPGPVITVFEFRPAPGIKISKIQSLVDDLALGLSAKSVRIVAPIPGKSVIGIEISNPQREWVYLKEIIKSEVFKNSNSPLTIALGKDISGNPVVADLRKMPHLLIAGSTGSGKSIFLHSVIISLIYKSSPEEIRFLMIDPKRIELSVYDEIPYLLHPVVLEPKMATKALRWVVKEMEKRYSLFEEVGARNLESYNENFKEKIPYIVVIIDELADLMVISSKEVETLLTRLAQMARAAGIHLLVATQRPSVDVITGLIKVNFPARISFQVTSKVDSRTILDTQGAERLLGAGDMLFMPPGSSHLQRIHGPYVSEEEVKRLVEYLKSIGKPEYLADLSEIEEKEDLDLSQELDDEDDKLYEAALKIAYQYGKISVSMLQRKLRIGYNRAARLVERMEEEGIVGPSDGVRPRPVLGPRKSV